MSTATQLASVRALISRIETGGAQSVSFAGRAITYANIQVLYDREAVLIKRLQDEERQSSGRGGSRIHRFVPL